MIRDMGDERLPRIEQPIRKRRPESAFARREMGAFLDSGLERAEVCEIPVSYDVARLCEALRNAAWALCEHPRRVKVMKRGDRVFLERRDPWA